MTDQACLAPKAPNRTKTQGPRDPYTSPQDWHFITRLDCPKSAKECSIGWRDELSCLYSLSHAPMAGQLLYKT